MQKKSILIVALSLVVTCAFGIAEAKNYDFKYETDNDSISVKSEISKKFLTVIISQYGKEYKTASDFQADENFLVKVIDESEKLPYEVLLSENLKCGKYTVKITDGNASESYVFVRPSEKSGFSSFVSALNNADGKTSFAEKLALGITQNLGIDDENFKKISPEISNCLFDFKPDKGYTNESFLENFVKYDGIILYSKGEISFEKLAGEYGVYFDGISDAYAGFTADEKKYADESFKYSDFENVGADKAVKNIIFLAKYKGAKSDGDLKDVCIEKFTADNVDMTIYNSISNDYYKSLVWSDLFSARLSATDVKYVENYFNERSIARKNDSQNENGNGNGGGSSSGGSKGGSNIGFGAYGSENTAAKYNGVFADMQNHWAEKDVEKMYDLKIINGFEDNTFRPENPVTRAEFVKMLTAVMGINPEGKCKFDDVDNADWYAPFIAAAYDNGLINGITEKRFAPNDKILRQDAAAVVFRAVKGVINGGENNVVFSDENEISDYAKDAVSYLSSSSVISGSNGNFYPLNNMTRAEAASLLLRVYNIITEV